MYQRGELVVYGIHGVCRVLELEIKTVNHKKTEYYVLAPVLNEQARFYIPTQNAEAVSKMHPILTRDGIMELLTTLDLQKDVWITDENKRKVSYKDIISRGDRAELICLIRALHLHRANQFAQGRKFHSSDESFLRDAEKLVTSEISVVMGIPMEEVGLFIETTVENLKTCCE